MGKKSKKSGTAAAAKARSGASGGVASGATPGSEGGGGSGGIGKKARCVSCLALIRDTAKGHACPGCSELYCWRCERKDFLSCPNGENCSFLLRRCGRCITGRTLSKELCAIGEGPLHRFCNWHFDVFKDIIERRDDLTFEALPFTKCRGKNCFGDDLSTVECSRCAEGPTRKKLYFCSSCRKARCRSCVVAAGEPAAAAFNQLFLNAGKASPHAVFDEFSDAVSATAPDAMALCDKCEQQTCFECLDFVEIKCMATLISLSARGDVQAGARGSEHTFQCSRCYWASKSCTNPTCPNEVGIPTKRCGGCHIDRYCSVECQAAAYPDHVAKCEKIQTKRIDSGMKVSARGSAASEAEETSVGEEQDEVKLAEWDREVAKGYTDAIGSAYKQEGGTASQEPWF